MFSNHNANLVVYDETEWFKDPDSPLFNYPYSNRKSILRKYNFDFRQLYESSDFSY